MDSSPSPSLSSRYIDRSRLVACRECRRSKIRCSRTFPCDACVRRGCTDICPDGIKETKRSKSDESLLQENARLTRRIRKLEAILLSLKYPNAWLNASAGPPHAPTSPGQEPQPSEDTSPETSDAYEIQHMSDPGSLHAHDHSIDSDSFFAELEQFSTWSDGGFPESPEGISAKNHDHSLLYRACGIFDRHNDVERNNTTPDSIVPDSHASISSTPSPLASLSPSSSASAPDASLPDPWVDTAGPASFGAEEDWDLPDGVFALTVSAPVNPHRSPARKPAGREHLPGQELINFDLCQRLLNDLGVVQGGLGTFL